MLEIVDIRPGSIAERRRLAAGDSIVSINGEDIHDAIDLQFCSSDRRLTVVVRRQDGTSRTVRIDKEPDENLGIACAPLRIRRCRNKCIFCFVDQMPAGCRRSLYVKDDDYRASFLYGNYITLGALAESDWERIFRQRLSPLYVSVHTTDPELRSFILGTTAAPDIMGSLRRLADGGIRVHTQLVLSPGINDGRHLGNTLRDLASLFPAVSSIAAVPVGLTACRKGLFPLKAFTPGAARDVIKIVRQFGDRFRKEHGTRLAYASDELFLKAKEPLPPATWYEDFPQIENGVGMASKFLREAARVRLPAGIAPVTVTAVTGESFSRILTPVFDRLKTLHGAVVRQVVVRNRFFGPSVTVAGLLTGQDILAALRRRRLGNLVLVPADALKEGERIFLDGMKLEQLEQELGAPVFPVETFSEVLDVMRHRGGGTT